MILHTKRIALFDSFLRLWRLYEINGTAHTDHTTMTGKFQGGNVSVKKYNLNPFLPVCPADGYTLTIVGYISYTGIVACMISCVSFLTLIIIVSPRRIIIIASIALHFVLPFSFISISPSSSSFSTLPTITFARSSFLLCRRCCWGQIYITSSQYQIPSPLVAHNRLKKAHTQIRERVFFFGGYNYNYNPYQ